VHLEDGKKSSSQEHVAFSQHMKIVIRFKENSQNLFQPNSSNFPVIRICINFIFSLFLYLEDVFLYKHGLSNRKERGDPRGEFGQRPV
jgi:hypothetical protein